MAHPGLLEWIGRQAGWAKDALRRHALLPNYELDPASKSEIIKRVRSACGISQEGDCQTTPVTAAHLNPQEGGDPGTLFVALGPVKNVARLAENQRLSFAQDGITLIYGDNGTGKSGYCRISKKLCRSLTTDALLGDVSVAGTKPPAQAQVDFSKRGQGGQTSITWVDGEAPPAEIASISVFDSKNARLYIDSENKIGFLPREVAILELHAKHCGEMDRVFDGEIRAANTQINVPLPAGYATGGDISKLLDRLAARTELPTEAEIRDAAKWEAADETKLTELSVRLATDPKALADRNRRISATLKQHAAKFAVADVAFSQTAVTEIAALFSAMRKTSDAAKLAAAEMFSDGPLPAVGQDAWRKMYEYAEAYVVSAGVAAQLPQAVGDLCALCQQPLSDDGAKRMQRFREFVTDAAAREAAAAKEALEGRQTEIEAVLLDPPAQVVSTLQELKESGKDGDELVISIGRWCLGMRLTRSGIIKAAGDGTFADVAPPPEAIAKGMNEFAEGLDAGATELEQAASGNAEALVQQRKQLSDLRDRNKLSQDLETILKRRTDLEHAAKLAKCKEAVSTRAVSLQITALRRDLVSADLESRIKTELGTLDLLHLPFKVTDRSAGGQSNFKVAIDTPVSAPNEEVLSEGEQRALALACFLGELGGDDKQNGIIVDDPVSSLDHIRIRRVARRLVKEAAKGRQVILFTHNLLFYNEVADAAAQHDPPIPIAKRIVRHEHSVGFGVISDNDEPWIAQAVKERIKRLNARLKEFEGRKDAGTDSYRRAVKDFYTDLRETWERLIEELLLGKVVERFNTDVKTQSLKGVVVDDDDYALVYWAMKGASERSGHDMAAGKQIGDPTLEDMKADLKKLEDYRAKITARRKETEERRKTREEAPAAKTG